MRRRSALAAHGGAHELQVIRLADAERRVDGIVRADRHERRIARRDERADGNIVDGELPRHRRVDRRVGEILLRTAKERCVRFSRRLVGADVRTLRRHRLLGNRRRLVERLVAREVDASVAQGRLRLRERCLCLPDGGLVLARINAIERLTGRDEVAALHILLDDGARNLRLHLDLVLARNLTRILARDRRILLHGLHDLDLRRSLLHALLSAAAAQEHGERENGCRQKHGKTDRFLL